MTDDTISRQAAIDALEEPRKVPDTWTDEYAVGERMQWEKDVKALNSLPSAQPEREKGEWIKKVRKSYPWHECTGHDADGNIHTISFQKEEITTTYRCSKCGFVVWDFEENYCPDCGRKMEKNENKETDSK